MWKKAQPSPALAAMYEADIARGIDPLAPSPVVVVENPTPAPAVAPFRIDPPDWDAEAREAQARERAQRLAEAKALAAQDAAELEPPEAPPTPDPPAPKQRRWGRAA